MKLRSGRGLSPPSAMKRRPATAVEQRSDARRRRGIGGGRGSVARAWSGNFTFEDKSSAINQNTGVNERLTEMIMKWYSPGQKLAVAKPEYKTIIEERLKVPFWHDANVMELMWGIQYCMPILVPREKSQLTELDCFPVSQGLQKVLSRYGCNDIKPEMVNERIVATASALFECDSVEKRHSKALRFVGRLMKRVSGINTDDWSLLKIAIALKRIWWRPEPCDSCETISSLENAKLVINAEEYEIDLRKEASALFLCLVLETIRPKRRKRIAVAARHRRRH
uniref:Uncharacterized protein n=1 Tax=Leersia perrieri TaxID=77586 RepID=A0A0D9V6D0_9ORYZ